MSTAPRTLKALYDQLRVQGWSIERLDGVRQRAYPPDKSKPAVVFSNSNTSDVAFMSIVRDLRQSGFVWPPKQVTDERAEVSSTPFPPKPNPTSSPDVNAREPESLAPERAFEQLRDARAYALAANDERERAHKALAKAQAEFDKADRELAEAWSEVRRFKAAFDTLFEAAS